MGVVLEFRRFVRRLLQWAGRLLVALLTRTRVYGREHVPRGGAYILAGNHDAAIEIVLMLAVSRRPPVFLGTGDVPLDRSFRLLGSLYGFIPYRRGSMDRRGLDDARAALRAGEPLGVFPEGGIWQSGAKDTRRGVAWLSDRERVPVITLGFRGIVGALPEVFALRRPRLSVHVGPLVPPPHPSQGPPRERQQVLAGEIERRIRELAGQQRGGAGAGVEVRRAAEPTGILVRIAPSRVAEYRRDHGVRGLGEPTGPAEELRWTDPEGQALAHFLSTSLLRNVFIENLHRHVRALEPGCGFFPLAETLRAARILRGYFRLRNPGFLAYRFGDAEAAAIMEGLARLRWGLEEHAAGLDTAGESTATISIELV